MRIQRLPLLAAAAFVVLCSAVVESAAAESKHGAPKRSAISAESAVSIASVEDKTASPLLRRGLHGSAVLRAQVLLDRAWFSPGEIDAFSENMRKAVQAFQEARGIASTGRVDRDTWLALRSSDATILVEYTVTDKDTAGPITSRGSHFKESEL